MGFRNENNSAVEQGVVVSRTHIAAVAIALLIGAGTSM